MLLNKYITKNWRQQGITLNEPDDHVLELRLHDEVLARFSQTGATPENILKVCRKELEGRMS